MEAHENIVFRAVERKYFRTKGLGSRENPLCRNCSNAFVK